MDTDTYYDLRMVIMLISIGLPLVPLVMGVIRYRYLETGLRLLLVLLSLTLLFDGTASFYALHLKENNAWIYNFFTLIEFTLIAVIFYLWHENRLLKKILLGAIPLFFAFWAVAFILKSQKNLDNEVLTVEGVVIVLLAVLTMFTLLNRDTVPVLKNPIFWVSSALVVYFAGNLILFALAPTLFHELAVLDSRWIWVLHSLLNVIKNLLFLGGILACRKIYSSLSSAAPSSS